MLSNATQNALANSNVARPALSAAMARPPNTVSAQHISQLQAAATAQPPAITDQEKEVVIQIFGWRRSLTQLTAEAHRETSPERKAQYIAQFNRLKQQMQQAVETMSENQKAFYRFCVQKQIQQMHARGALQAAVRPQLAQQQPGVGGATSLPANIPPHLAAAIRPGLNAVRPAAVQPRPSGGVQSLSSQAQIPNQSTHIPGAPQQQQQQQTPMMAPQQIPPTAMSMANAQLSLPVSQHLAPSQAMSPAQQANSAMANTRSPAMSQAQMQQQQQQQQQRMNMAIGRPPLNPPAIRPAGPAQQNPMAPRIATSIAPAATGPVITPTRVVPPGPVTPSAPQRPVYIYAAPVPGTGSPFVPRKASPPPIGEEIPQDAPDTGSNTPNMTLDSVLGKRKLNDLVEQIDPNERLDPETEEFMLHLADDFILEVTRRACKSAKHRGSTTLGVKDLQLELERNWNLRIPGYAHEVRPTKRTTHSNSHMSRLSIIHRQRQLDTSKRRAAALAKAAALLSEAAGPLGKDKPTTTITPISKDSTLELSSKETIGSTHSSSTPTSPSTDHKTLPPHPSNKRRASDEFAQRPSVHDKKRVGSCLVNPI
ncbi:transcription initiation factor TFIID subunit A-domain-containing protein [Phlyctochytrium arcticum]|nr:transcription initiation factor TFIID subunit A-domain-containing protein [Phlyctochytrium arcticum]